MEEKTRLWHPPYAHLKLSLSLSAKKIALLEFAFLMKRGVFFLSLSAARRRRWKTVKTSLKTRGQNTLKLIQKSWISPFVELSTNEGLRKFLVMKSGCEAK